MKRTQFSIVILTFICLFLVLSPTFAKESGLGFHVGYLKSENMDSGFYFGGQYRNKLSPAFGFEVALSYRDEKSDGNIEYQGEEHNATTLARSYPLTTTLIFTLFAERKVPVNLMGGVGVYFYSLKFRLKDSKEISEFDTRFGYHLGVGTEFPISYGVKLETSLKYLFLDLKDEYGDVVISEAKANALMINLGLTFYF